MAEDHTVETGDLSIAAWWKMHGLQIIRARRDGYRFDFLFRDPENKAEELAVEFANSPVARFDLEVRALKKLCSVNRS